MMQAFSTLSSSCEELLGFRLGALAAPAYVAIGLAALACVWLLRRQGCNQNLTRKLKELQTSQYLKPGPQCGRYDFPWE
jgi:hypothetical protein